MKEWKKFKFVHFLFSSFLLGILIYIEPKGIERQTWLSIASASFIISLWMTEALPIGITSLLPLLLFPLLGLNDMKSVAHNYTLPIIFLFLGGFMIAISLEKWNLHKRIALSILRFTGTKPNQIILGFMCTTALLSMWISNTATAVMMLPIGLSIIDLTNYEKSTSSFATALLLAIAYAANIGGMATLIGTPPNLVLVGIFEEQFQYDFNFLEWFSIGFPISILLLFTCYLLLTKVLFSIPPTSLEASKSIIEKELQRLGPLTKAERLVLIIFSLTASAWIFKNQINSLLPVSISNSQIALMGASLLFITPVDNKKNEFVLHWDDTKNLPWHIILLFGGGLALAASLQKNGVLELIGSQFINFDASNVFLLVILVTIISLFLTEFMSNVALVTVLIPIICGLAIQFSISPILLCMPVTFAASCAFMMPISTPPNAVVFASKRIKIKEMIRVGFILNLCAVVVISVACFWLVPAFL